MLYSRNRIGKREKDVRYMIRELSSHRVEPPEYYRFVLTELKGINRKIMYKTMEEDTDTKLIVLETMTAVHNVYMIYVNTYNYKLKRTNSNNNLSSIINNNNRLSR